MVRGSSCLVDPGDPRLENPVYYPPDDAEFSRDEIDAFTGFFVGFLEGYFESVKSWLKDRFLLAVESNLIVFGFDGEKFFTRRFHSSRTFKKTRVALAKHLPAPDFYSPCLTSVLHSTRDMRTTVRGA